MTDEAEMVGYSVSFYEGHGIYVATKEIGTGFAAILESALWTKIAHNYKFEYKILQKLNVNAVCFSDTMLAAYVLGEYRVGLKALVKQYLGVDPITYKEVTQGKDMSELQPEDVAEYAAADADHTMRLWPGFKQRMDDEEVYDVYQNIELPLVPVLAEMERAGMCVDVETCDSVAHQIHSQILDYRLSVESLLKSLGIHDVNINSNDMMAQILEHYGVPLTKRTETTKRYIIDETALNSVRDWWPELINPLLNYRKFTKLSSYVQNFSTLRGPDGRLHTSFNQAGHWEDKERDKDVKSAPATGRISSSAPNLQNIPHHRAMIGETDWGYKLRSCIVASPGCTLLSADLGQEEPRIVAVIAQDQTLLTGFSAGQDVYRPATNALYPFTCGEFSDGEFKQRYDYERFVGKTFFLAWYYGAGAGRLKSLDKNLTPDTIREGLALLSTAHPARQAFLNETWDMLKADGYVTSLHGRRRRIPKAWSPRKQEREEALREAANCRVQATAADILKKALVRIHNALQKQGLKSVLVSTVHDEVILDVLGEELDKVEGIVRRAFEGLLPDVALPLEMFVGESWADRDLI